MKEGLINLVIVSNKKGIRNYIISSKEFIFSSILIVLSFVLIISSIVFFNYSLRIQNNEYKSIKNDLNKELREVEKEMEVKVKYVDKINLMVEDDSVDTINRKSPKYGIGGGDELLNDEINYINNEKIIYNNSNKKGDIFKKIDVITNDLENLVLNLQNMVFRLNSTPSIFPANGIITSGFGYRKSPFTGRKELHRGIDILNKEGTPIISPADGIVKEVLNNSLWGNSILISHSNNIETQYGHLKDIKVKIGQKIKRGDIIGTIGRTGRTTGPHLHYQIWANKTPIDPMDYIIKENSVIED